MFKSLFSVVLTMQFTFLAAWNNYNCSLKFNVKTTDRWTKFPIEFQGDYTFIGSFPGDLIVDYVIIPLTTLPIGQGNNETRFIIARNTTEWRFFINESSTIRLCAYRSDDEEDIDRLCREIHIGISELCSFWDLSLEIFYFCLLSLVIVYYLIHYIAFPRCKTRRKPKPLPSRSIHRYRRTDTFEDEKVYSHMSDEE